MRVATSAALLIAMISESAIGSSIRLTCVPTDPPSSKSIAMEVDVENLWIRYGDISFEITHPGDRYITAIERRIAENFVGGEVLVLNRITGDLKRAAVYLAATPKMILGPENNPPSTSGKLVAKTFEARCSKPLL